MYDYISERDYNVGSHDFSYVNRNDASNGHKHNDQAFNNDNHCILHYPNNNYIDCSNCNYYHINK